MIKQETIKIIATMLVILILTSVTPANNVTIENTERQQIKNDTISEDKAQDIKEKSDTILGNETQKNNTIIENKTKETINNTIQTRNETSKKEEIKDSSKNKKEENTNQSGNIESIKEKGIQTPTTITEEIEKKVTKEQLEKNKSKEKKNHVFYQGGKKSFELESEESKIPEITKTETTKDKEKKVIISSEEHVTTPIKVYSDLQKEVKKEEIKIFWENEEAYITNIEYFDENKNGLIERVSWTVPHLSEQIYNIILETGLENSTLDTIEIEEITSPSGDTQNPINFSFNVTYNKTENLNCTLRIENSSNKEVYFYSGLNLEGQNTNLPNETYTWEYICSDIQNSSVTPAAKTGTFTIAEHFYVSNLKKTYLRKWDGEIYGNSAHRDISIRSQKASPVTTYIEKIGGQKSPDYTKSTTNQGINLNNTNIFTMGIHKVHTLFTTERLQDPYHLEQEFSVAQIDITQPTTAIQNQEISIEVEINSPTENIGLFILDFGDSTSQYIINNQDSKTLDKTIKHTYTQTGDKEIKATFKIGEETYEVSKGNIEITSESDDEEPEITLLNPSNNEVIKDDTIIFKFQIDDNIKTDECNFSIYNTTFNAYSESTKVYSKKYNNPEQDKTIELELKDFEERQYAWEIECEDNSSNYNFEANFFTVELNNTQSISSTSGDDEELEYDRKDEVRDLMAKATAFIEKEEQFSAEEKEALEDLEIMEDIKTYKKRLLDIEQYLGKNYKYTADEAVREKMINDYKKEIDSIKEEMVTEFELVEKYEYVKNGNTLNWAEIIKEYIEKTETKVSSSISSLTEENKEKQQQISISTTIKKIKLSYTEESKEIILVKKKLDIKEEDQIKILEVIPKDLFEDIKTINFVQDLKEISEKHIYEISSEDLKDNEIIYSIEDKNLKLKDFEETDTVLFTEKTKKRALVNTLSGFLVLDSDSSIGGANTTFLILIIIIALIIITLWIISLMNKRALKKDPKSAKILDLIENIRKNLKENDIKNARENYKSIQEEYKEIEPKKKKALYKTLKKANLAIDKKDIWGLVKEYQTSKNNFKKQETLETYNKIKKIYTRLPNKERLEVLKIINS